MKHMNRLLAVMALSLATSCAQEPKPFTMTDTERLRLENVQLRLGLLQEKLKPVQAELQSLIKEIMKSNGDPKDMRFDPQTFTFVKVPTPAPKAEAPKPEKSEGK